MSGRFIETAEDVVCVAVPPGYTEYRYPLEPFHEPLVQSWRGQVRGSGLMLVAILPPGYAFDGPEGCDWPTKAKIVSERMAVYWLFAGDDATVEPAWRIAPVDVAELVECVRAINRRPSSLQPPEPPVPGAVSVENGPNVVASLWTGVRLGASLSAR